MKLIIDIDKNVFTRLFDNGIEDYAIVNDDLFTIAKSIRTGIPLPERHGDLVDKKALCDYFWDNRSKLYTHKDLQIAIEKADAIIKADKESEGKE